METNTKTGPGIAFWIVGGLFLLWNAFGCYLYYMDVSMSAADYAKAYGAEMTAVRDLYPTWSLSAYAVAVWGGLLAAISYLLKKKWAAPIFGVSLIAAIISFVWGFTNAEYKAAAGGGFWIMPVVVVLIGAFEVWWSRKKVADGTLN